MIYKKEKGEIEVSSFKVDLDQVTDSYTKFESLEAELRKYKEKVDKIRCNFNISGEDTFDLRQQLKIISEDIDKEECVVYKLKEVLEESIRKYRMTETKLSHSINKLKYQGDFVDSFGEEKVKKLFLNPEVKIMLGVNIPKDVKNAYFKNEKKIYDIEKKLSYLGYDVGKVDGVNTKETKNSVKQFQEDYNLKVTGEMDKKTKELIGKFIKQSR